MTYFFIRNGVINNMDVMIKKIYLLCLIKQLKFTMRKKIKLHG